MDPHLSTGDRRGAERSAGGRLRDTAPAHACPQRTEVAHRASPRGCRSSVVRSRRSRTTEGASMKVLVATRRTQGARAGDYDWCVDGELVWIQEPCGRDRRREQDSCGCGRGFAGLASHRATTTAEVRTIPGMTRDQYASAIRMGMEDGGWPG